MGERPPKIELNTKSAASELASSAGAASPDADAVFVPSAVMRVEMPGESQVNVPVFASRRAYAPPKLSQAIPGKVKMVEPLSPLIAQWLASIVRALRGMTMYADNNTRRKDFVDQSFSVLEDIFGKVSRIDLLIAEDHLAFGADIVHYNPEPFESLPRLLYDGSLRSLTILRGLTALELVRFMGAIATDFSRPENHSDDLVAIFARMNLPHVRAKGAEAPAAAIPKYVPPPVPAPPPPAPAPARLPSAYFMPIDAADETEDEAEDEAPTPSSLPAVGAAVGAAIEGASEPMTQAADAVEMIDPYGADDEATVFAHPVAPTKKKRPDLDELPGFADVADRADRTGLSGITGLSDITGLSALDDEATVQDVTARGIDVSDLLDQATSPDGAKSRRE